MSIITDFYCGGKCLPFPNPSDQQKAESAKKCAEKCVRNMIHRLETKDTSLNTTLNEYFGLSISDPNVEQIKSNYDEILKSTKNNPVCYDSKLSKANIPAQTNPICPRIYLGNDFLKYKSDEDRSETIIHESAHHGLAEISYNPFSDSEYLLRKKPFSGELSSNEYETYIEKLPNGDKVVWAKDITTGKVNKRLLNSLKPEEKQKLPDSYSNAVMDSCKCNDKPLTDSTKSEKIEEMMKYGFIIA